MKDISVIVPVYKAEGTVEATVKSICNQTHKNIEILLVDDGSPDNSGKLCDELALKDGRIKVIHKKNGGVSSARNEAVRQASSELLCFVDSDDEIEATTVEKLVKSQAETGAQLVVAGLMLTSRRVAAAYDWCKTLKGEGENVGKLVEKGKSQFAGPEILGKTLGIVGLGAIGALVAQSAQALGMSVIAYDPFATGKTDIKLVELDEIFAQSDYITLHAPLNDSTRGMINAETIAKMKDGVRILNFARGELVASKDIIDALASGKAGAYVTDFPTDEQLGAEGVTAIPHLGASTPESEENCAMMAADEVSAYLLRGEIKNSVNLPNTLLAESFAVRTCFIHKEDADTFAVKAENAARAAGANVTSIFTANKKDMGYTVIDTDKAFDASGVEGAIRVRTI